MNTVVAIGCSETSEYAFLIPFSAVLWRDVIGFTPRIFLIGDEAEWSCGRLGATVAALKSQEIRYQFVPHIDGYIDSTLAQNVRHYAAASSDIDENQWVMVSDADIWPIHRDFYHQHVNSLISLTMKAFSYYSNGDHFQGKEVTLAKWDSGDWSTLQTLPTCHIAMRAKEWRTLFDLIPDNVVGSMKAYLDRVLKPRFEGKDPATSGEASWECWMSDQRIVTERLCRQDWFDSQVRLVSRAGHPPVDRLDRSHPDDWDGFDVDRWVDAHVLKAPEEEANWSRILPILDVLIPQHGAWARAYRDAYVS